MSHRFFTPGDIVEYSGLKWHWIKSIQENTSLLEIGRKYTVDSVAVFSSWCRITLKEFDKNIFFSAGMFNRPSNFIYTKCSQCNGCGDYYSQERFISCKDCEGNGYIWKEKV